MSYKSALHTLQWSTHLETEGEEGTIYWDGLDFEPSKDLKEKIEKDWESFREKAEALGFDDPEEHRKTCINLSEWDYWDHVAHDFILSRNRHGSGFSDGDWYEPMATKLTELAHSFGELEIYLSDENLLEAY